MPTTDTSCPLCNGRLASRSRSNDTGGPSRVACDNCGDHLFTWESLEALADMEPSEGDRARISHCVFQLPLGATITQTMIESFADTPLPPAMERLDLLVLYFARHLRPGERVVLDSTKLRAKLGTVTAFEAQWVVEEAIRLGYLPGLSGQSSGEVGVAWSDAVLTVEGWRRHAALMRDGAGSRHAFMAMMFGDTEMDGMYANHMRPAVEQAGFDLRTTNESHKTAGSIDNRMRVEIRTSRFVICDLTHGNRGAYWEAGFAEGLGRPVFYTCRRDVLEDRSHPDHPHFDTAHQLIVAWDPGVPAPAMQELKDVIRATLPAEARMEDI